MKTLTYTDDAWVSLVVPVLEMVIVIPWHGHTHNIRC